MKINPIKVAGETLSKHFAVSFKGRLVSKF
jgi:hypothetical protein